MTSLMNQSNSWSAERLCQRNLDFKFFRAISHFVLNANFFRRHSCTNVFCQLTEWNFLRYGNLKMQAAFHSGAYLKPGCGGILRCHLQRKRSESQEAKPRAKILACVWLWKPDWNLETCLKSLWHSGLVASHLLKRTVTHGACASQWPN